VVNFDRPELHLSQIQRYNYNALNIAESFRVQIYKNII